ncbi:uncharacterized protein C8Q71DRAFT_782615 [Rhodofomes roseus]|uniref:Uncharacterized protein n=1 Tax=Rhodofomes roseus TaxID=34475 RepID=A0ABQ8K4W5_9APHY|nr:uncharacterized protein C8Q71DRAFT_782615 [Rhodofomes roseus]KAH9831450.1 hypothetical protein C8Q71DRAFT_782615 [Rhodofomes roseus]
MQSITYGVHVVTFAACKYTWFHRAHKPHVSRCWPWMLVAIAFFVFGTCDVAFNFYNNLIAFIFYTGPGGANAEFDRLSTWVNVIRSIWFTLNIALSDAVLIYRCWLVYAHSPRANQVVRTPKTPTNIGPAWIPLRTPNIVRTCCEHDAFQPISACSDSVVPPTDRLQFLRTGMAGVGSRN